MNYPFKATFGRFTTFHAKESAAFKQARAKGGIVYRHNPYVTPDHTDESGQWEKLETPATLTPKYRKNSIEARIDALLPEFPSFDVIAHELWRDERGWSVNDSWHLARGCDREEAIRHLANRWQVFKANYMPRARVRDLEDISCDVESGCLLEVNCTAFAEVRNGF